MLDTKYISVIIPYYNDHKSIQKCLDSVLNQSLRPKEVIIVDDCSEQVSKGKLIKIVEDFDTSIISIYHNRKRMNGAFCRNFGMKNSKGYYIALLDADDYWEKEHLKISYEFLIKSDSDFVYSNIVREKLTSKEIIKVSNIDDIDIDSRNILFNQPPQTGSFFFKRDVFEKIKFDESLNRHQDYQFFYDIVNSNFLVKYNNQNTAVYCTSPRPRVDRIDPMSSLKFWHSVRQQVDRELLIKKLIYFLYLSLRYNKPGVKEIINELESLNCKNKWISAIKKLGNRKVSYFISLYLYVVVYDLKGWLRK
ncbi:glycosyltransferase family 2 protein [Vibrio parahaemolyticus]|uniref:glycosyltransferase family 2 protein n=1 Tax=Vibrio TaxID=662 RepID=UPI00046EC784|nr:glycosyltransferase family 2 protein [Vibrio parahaemolyticus]MDF4894585.1 glycosyltransferase family 2 protein [Vibrio parahaemolyticus]